jgi:hypothetical protein
MEKIMSKTNETTKPRELTESDLNAVSGGAVCEGCAHGKGSYYFPSSGPPVVVLVHEPIHA